MNKIPLRRVKRREMGWVEEGRLVWVVEELVGIGVGIGKVGIDRKSREILAIICGERRWNYWLFDWRSGVGSLYIEVAGSGLDAHSEFVFSYLLLMRIMVDFKYNS